MTMERQGFCVLTLSYNNVYANIRVNYAVVKMNYKL